LMATSLPFGHLMRIMRGTELSSPRCEALKGEIGINVHCAIYAGRPSTCRNFIRSWEKDTGNYLCDRARAVYGMQPFSKY
jgi:Fe-S-cluster containining protein